MYLFLLHLKYVCQRKKGLESKTYLCTWPKHVSLQLYNSTLRKFCKRFQNIEMIIMNSSKLPIFKGQYGSWIFGVEVILNFDIFTKTRHNSKCSLTDKALIYLALCVYRYIYVSIIWNVYPRARFSIGYLDFYKSALKLVFMRR